MSQPFKLFRLQRFDSQLEMIRNRLREIETSLADDLTLRQANNQVVQANSALDTAKITLRRAEDAVGSQRIKIDQTESTLYGGKVHNPKELQDLQNEAIALRRYLVTLEDRQLEAMIAAEEAEKLLITANNNLSQISADSEVKNKSLVSEQTNLTQEEKMLLVERQAAANAIPNYELQLYAQIQKTRRGIAVAKVVDNSCSACGSTLSSSQLHLARSLNQIVRCESCGRILYGGS